MEKEKIQAILKLKKEKNAVILAHNYQNPEIQEIADFVGDSLELAKISKELKENFVIFCGVFFMAETAHMLAPDKKVVLPILGADCPMARMISPQEVLDAKKKHPKAAVVTYVNSTAEVKALSDICCTSSNAMRVVNSLPQDQILFIPDANLGQNIARMVAKEFFYVKGYCYVHEGLKEEEIIKTKEQYPHAEVIMHPEVNPLVARHAHKLLSTGGMLQYAQRTFGKTMIIGTEKGLLYRLQKLSPQNTYHNVGRDLICPDMKKITLDSVLQALDKEEPQIVLEPQIREKAKKAIEKMLVLG